MAVDTSIYSQFGTRPKSMMDYENEFAQQDLQKQQVQQNALALDMGRQKADEYQRGVQEQGVIRNALLGLGAGATDEQRINALKGTGLPGGFSQADALQKTLLERQKTGAEVGYKQAQTQKEQIAAAKARVDLLVNATGSARDQASYTQAVQMLAANGIDVSGIPPQFDPAYVANARQQAMSVKEQIEAQQRQAQLAEQARGHDLTYKATTAGHAVSRENSIRADARQRELAEITRETAKATRADKQADKRTADVDKEVTKFAATVQKEGIPELETAVSEAEGAVGRYKPGQVPGVGPLKNILPAAVMSSEGKDVRQALAQVRNIVLSARSGAAVTDQELRRLVEEIGTGAGMTEDDMRKGLKKVRDRIEKIKENAAGGVSDDVLNTYTERGGLPIKRGGAKPAAPAGGGAKFLGFE